ncbi:dolichyl-phosphate beta-glucosyltransferase [Actinoallomurus vinaceus]|uniref:dolichyl-phosphate beta-glucosyltransferase n=1 Tax=Actinoallomurus vinaceus TaxID=1080074 RepID=UPI0031ED67B8
MSATRTALGERTSLVPVPSVVDLSVIIPAYNERFRLRATLEAISGYLCSSDLCWELIVVDDGSQDGTHRVVESAARIDPRIRVIRSPYNRGKGHAVRLGVAASQGAQVFFCDADLPTPIDELDRLRSGLRGGAAAAIGSRAVAGSRIEVRRPPAREILARLGNRVIRTVATPGIHDTQCGFKLFDGNKARRAFALARIDGWGFDVEILYLFRRLGWPVAEVPVRWAHRSGSKVRSADYLRVLADVVRVRWRHAGVRVSKETP